jgi:cyclic pyranopterin phosphate synthase
MELTRRMDIVYGMPGHASRLFINVIHACPNACYFCVDFKGDTFYGFDLKTGPMPTADEIVEAAKQYSSRQSVSEVYYCGIGEPLLRYETVVETARRIRDLFSPSTILAVNTSGTFYLRNPQVDFASSFDLIQVSLNAESEEKYNLICRPKVRGAYRAMMAFLRHLRRFLDESRSNCRVELSVVDPSDVQHLPARERTGVLPPKPDFDECRRIASDLGWPLKIKTLMKDCERRDWSNFADSVRDPATSKLVGWPRSVLIDFEMPQPNGAWTSCQVESTD